jgi:hypothetical protein
VRAQQAGKAGAKRIAVIDNIGRIESYTGKGLTNVRFGSKADIVRYQRDVRFTPKSGHCRTTVGCPRVLVPIALLFVANRKLHDFDVLPDGGAARKWLGEEAGAKEVGCRILRDFLKNFRACPNAAPTAMAGYF